MEKNTNDTDGKSLYTLIEKDELVKMGGPAQAASYIEAEPGYAFSGSWRGMKELFLPEAMPEH